MLKIKSKASAGASSISTSSILPYAWGQGLYGGISGNSISLKVGSQNLDASEIIFDKLISIQKDLGHNHIYDLSIKEVVYKNLAGSYLKISFDAPVAYRIGVTNTNYANLYSTSNKPDYIQMTKYIESQSLYLDFSENAGASHFIPWQGSLYAEALGNSYSYVLGSQNDTIIGGSGADSFNGGGGSDFIVGGEGNDNLLGDYSAASTYTPNDGGNDTLVGGMGNDNLFGGNGNDTAEFLGISTNYTLRKNGASALGDSWTITDTKGTDGVDKLYAIEFLKFSDKTVSISSLGSTLSIAATDAMKNEGNSGSTPFTFTVTRTGDVSGVSSVMWSANSDVTVPATYGAANAADFTGGAFPSGTLSFAAGETTKTITLNVAGDTLSEGGMGEVFQISLSGATGATITTASAGGVILNDDNAANLPYSVRDIKATGAADNRIDIVFLGDGYRASELTTYTTHIAGLTDYLFNGSILSQPFGRYKNFFNIHAIDVVSNESGADIPNKNTYKDTALGASFSYGGGPDRLLYTDPTLTQKALNDSLAGKGYKSELTFITVNTETYGGGGGTYAVYAGANANSREVALHEAGHSFAHLADEYSYGGATSNYTGTEPTAVNLTKDSSGTKWSRWAGYNQEGIGIIGAYEGGGYYEQGLYRPSLNSKMKELDKPFDAISREAFVLEFYKYVDPLDTYSFKGQSLSIKNADTLFVKTIDASVISVDWKINGKTVQSGGETLDIKALGLANGTYTVTAFAYDTTDWVRADRSSLEQTVTWTLTKGDAATATLAIAATDAVKNEGNSGSTPFSFTVTRTGDLSAASTVVWSANAAITVPAIYAVADGADFTGGAFPSGTLNFAAGETSKTITVNVAGDTVSEGGMGEVFQITLSGAAGAVIGTASASGTILNDDTVSAAATNDILILQANSPGVISGGVGDDVYMLSGFLVPAGKSITLSDTQGSNTLQLVGGLAITGSIVTKTALQLTLNNGGVITVLGADSFAYDVGGNSLQTSLSLGSNFSTFASTSLGVTVPTSGTASGGIKSFGTAATGAKFYTSPSAASDIVAVQTASPAVLSLGQGDDTYILSNSALAAGKTLTVSDAQGANSIQFVAGFAIASFTAAATALQMKYTNGAEVTLLGADQFTYDIGGNLVAGLNNTDISYASFLSTILGVTLPTTGTVSGGAKTFGSTGGGSAIPLIAGTSLDADGTAISITLTGISDPSLVGLV